MVISLHYLMKTITTPPPPPPKSFLHLASMLHPAPKSHPFKPLLTNGQRGKWSFPKCGFKKEKKACLRKFPTEYDIQTSIKCILKHNFTVPRSQNNTSRAENPKKNTS
ncbi:hypothetical protein Hanom_Chr04g00306491 [Helianthus anomalus]